MTILPKFAVFDFDELSDLDFALCHGPYFYCRYDTSNRRIGA